MWDAMPLLDDEQLMTFLLKRDAPAGVTVVSDLNWDSKDKNPLVTFSVGGSGQDGNGPGLWQERLTLSTFADTPGEAFELAKTMYAVVHAWSIPGSALLDNVGAVEDVEDAVRFYKVGTAQMNGKSVTQYTGSFDLVLRNR